MGLALVTGGAGFIGSHLTRGLLARRWNVRVFDDFSEGLRENLESIRGDIDLIEGDVRSVDDCRRACRGVEVVFHLAALGSVPRSVTDPVLTNAVNVDGTLNVLVAAKDSGIRRLVFSSSSSVYGDTPVLPKREDMTPNPMSPYAVSKLAGEEYCKVFFANYGFEAVCLRYFNVFGPRQNPHSQYAAVIPKFLDALTDGHQPVIYGDGLQTRDFTYVENVVHANVLAAATPELGGKVMNIACGDRITVLDTLNGLARMVERETKPRFDPPRTGDIKDSQADVDLARRLMGYETTVSFDDGLSRTVEAYLGSLHNEGMSEAARV